MEKTTRYLLTANGTFRTDRLFVRREPWGAMNTRSKPAPQDRRPEAKDDAGGRSSVPLILIRVGSARSLFFENRLARSGGVPWKH